MSTSAVKPAPLEHVRLGSARGRAPRGRGAAWRDILTASDPGLNRLVAAVVLMVALAATLGVVHVAVRATHVLWVSAPAGAPPAVLAAAAAQHHGVTVLAMLLGGLVAFMSAIAVMDTAPRTLTVTMALMPVPTLATIALAISLHGHRTLAIAGLALVMGLGTYARRFVPRFGPRAFLYGALLFAGYLFGFLAGAAVGEAQLPDLAGLLWLAVAVNLAAKLLLQRPLERRRVLRTAAAFRARGRRVLTATLAVLDADGARDLARAERRLDHRLTRLDETALVIDGTVADPGRLPAGASAASVHDELFELELLLQDVARTTRRLAAGPITPEARAAVRGWIADLGAGHADRAADAVRAFARPRASLDGDDDVALLALADAVVALAAVLRTWPRHLRITGAAPDQAPFTSAVGLIFGDLPGSALVSAQAAAPASRRHGALLARLRLDPAAQAAVRMTLAVGVAAAIGCAVSPSRFYWAVLAVFLVYMGTNTAGEQATKAVERVLGTVVGILLGSVLAHAIGQSSWSVAVIVLALGFGVYVLKVSYALMTLAITVTVAQLYEQLAVYSNHLLVLRLEETAIGAGVALAAALLIFPVNTRRATRVAARAYLTQLEELLAGVRAQVQGGGEGRLTTASRALDHATHQLTATVGPLRRSPLRRRDRVEHTLALLAQTAHEARNLVAAADRLGELDPQLVAGFTDVLAAQGEVVAALDGLVGSGVGGARPRAASDALSRLDAALAHESTQTPARRLVRELDRFDATLAELGGGLALARP